MLASLNNSVVWAGLWNMFFNFLEMSSFAYGNIFPDTIETQNGTIKVTKVNAENDLDVIFDSKLKLREHISTKVNKANQILGLIFRTFTYMDKEIFLNLVQVLSRPHLEYATSLWSPMYTKDIQIENVWRHARLVACLRYLS